MFQKLMEVVDERMDVLASQVGDVKAALLGGPPSILGAPVTVTDDVSSPKNSPPVDVAAASAVNVGQSEVATAGVAVPPTPPEVAGSSSGLVASLFARQEKMFAGVLEALTAVQQTVAVVTKERSVVSSPRAVSFADGALEGKPAFQNHRDSLAAGTEAPQVNPAMLPETPCKKKGNKNGNCKQSEDPEVQHWKDQLETAKKELANVRKAKTLLTPEELELTRAELQELWAKQDRERRYGPPLPGYLTEEEKKLPKSVLRRQFAEESRQRYLEICRQRGIVLYPCPQCGRETHDNNPGHWCARAQWMGPPQVRGGVPQREQLVVTGSGSGLTVRKAYALDRERFDKALEVMNRVKQSLDKNPTAQPPSVPLPEDAAQLITPRLKRPPPPPYDEHQEEGEVVLDHEMQGLAAEVNLAQALTDMYANPGYVWDF